MLYGMQTMSARVDEVQPDSPAAAAGFQPGDMVLAINGQKIDRLCRYAAHRRRQRRRDAARSPWNETAPTSSSRRRRCCMRKRTFSATSSASACLGIRRSPAPGDVKYQPVSPPRAVLMGVQETWFVVDKTLTYIGRVIIGREAANQLGGPIRIAQMSGQVASISFVGPDPSRCSAFGFDRIAQSVSDSAARRRPPFVLFDRSDARPAVVRTGAGGRFSHWFRNRHHVDDICNFQ